MKKIRIIKVPLEKDTFKRPRLHFPRMRKLYLEIIENKDKIKPELFDVEFDDSNYVEEPQTPPVKRNLDFSNAEQTPDAQNDNSPPQKKDDNNKSTADVKHIDSNDKEEHFKNKPNNTRKQSKYNHNDYDSDYENRQKSVDSVRSEPRRAKTRNEDIDLDKHLDDLLRASNEKKGGGGDKYKKSSFDVSPSNFNKYDDDDEAPSLSELRRRGHNIPKNMKSTEHFNESEEDKKRELLLKIRMLRKYYPDTELPEFSAYSSYGELKNTYEDTFRSLSIDSQVNSYERYIIMFSYGMEIVAGRFLKFDMQGFTKHQLQNINEYKRLLIELGEKSYTPGGSSLPVEVRLLFICLQQMALFLLMKSSGMGNLMGMLSSLGGSGGGGERRGQNRMAPPKL